MIFLLYLSIPIGIDPVEMNEAYTGSLGGAGSDHPRWRVASRGARQSAQLSSSGARCGRKRWRGPHADARGQVCGRRASFFSPKGGGAGWDRDDGRWFIQARCICYIKSTQVHFSTVY
jgi:hypothetical protein